MDFRQRSKSSLSICTTIIFRNIGDHCICHANLDRIKTLNKQVSLVFLMSGRIGAWVGKRGARLWRRWGGGLMGGGGATISIPGCKSNSARIPNYICKLSRSLSKRNSIDVFGVWVGRGKGDISVSEGVVVSIPDYKSSDAIKPFMQMLCGGGERGRRDTSVRERVVVISIPVYRSSYAVESLCSVRS